MLSDIHGNSPALDAVLREAESLSIDGLVVTGDVVSGPDPLGVLQRLVSYGDRVHWVRGNADDEVVEAFDGR